MLVTQMTSAVAIGGEFTLVGNEPTENQLIVMKIETNETLVLK